jgi:hypothetical protein
MRNRLVRLTGPAIEQEESGRLWRRRLNTPANDYIHSCKRAPEGALAVSGESRIRKPWRYRSAGSARVPDRENVSARA